MKEDTDVALRVEQIADIDLSQKDIFVWSVVLGGEDGDPAPGGGIFRSMDNGDSWTRIGLTQSIGFSLLIISK